MATTQSILIANSSFETALKACQFLVGNPEKEEKIKAEDYIAYARKKAAEQNHKAAIFGFEMALESDTSSRFEILNEYADQLSFNSQAHLAIPFYLEIMKAHPTEEATRHAEKGLARAYRWTNQREAAVEEYEKILSQEPQNEEVRIDLRTLYLQLAKEKAEKNDHNTSAAFFLKAMEIDPNKRSELLREYADQLSFNSQAHLAIPFYEEAIHANLSPENNLQSHLSLARAYDWTNKKTEALSEYQKVLSLDPDNQEAKVGEKKIQSQLWSQYARTIGRQGNYKEAIHWFAKAIEIDPNRRGELLKEYADQLSYNSQQHEAIPLYLEILNSHHLEPDAALSTHIALATAYYWTGQYEKAIEQYQSALSLDPNNTQAKQGIKEVYEKIKKENKKKEAADAYQNGLCFEKKLEIFHAMEAFKRSLYYDPENSEVQIHYGWFLHNFGFQEEAVQQFCHILTLFKDKRPVYQTLGWSFREMGQFENSFNAFSHVFSFRNYRNCNNQYMKIASCQEEESRQKEIDLIHKILCFKEWGAIQFPTYSRDSFLYCNLLKRKLSCKKIDCHNRGSFESRNLLRLQQLPCTTACPSQENKIALTKELLHFYSYMGKPCQARALAQFLIWNDETDYYSYLLYINALMNKKNYKQAFCEYLMLIKRVPGNAFLYFRLGEAYEEAGLLYSAKLSYEFALYFGENNRIQRAYTRVLAQLGCCQEAFSLSEEIKGGEDESFLSMNLSLAEMHRACGSFCKAASYYREVLECFPYNREALYGLLQSSAFTGNIANTHLARERLFCHPYPNWKERKYIQYYKPPEIDLYIDYFKDNTTFAEFDSGLSYDFYKNNNLRITGSLIYSNFTQIHFEPIDRFGALLNVDKLCDHSEINFQVDDYFYKRINVPPDHITSKYLQLIMPTTSIRPIVPPTTTTPDMQPILDHINSIANSEIPFRHSKNSINYYLNYQHFWTYFNVNFGLRYYDVINTVPLFNNQVFNYALQYGAVALNIKTKDMYGSINYSKDKLSLQGNVVYGRYSLRNNKQARWFSAYYSLMNLPEVGVGYTYFYLNFTDYAPFFIEKGYLQRAYYDPQNFETHTAQLYTRFMPTNNIEYKFIGYLYYTPKSNCIGRSLEIDFRYLFNENYSLTLQFNYLAQELSVGRDGLLDGYRSLYGLLNLKYGF